MIIFRLLPLLFLAACDQAPLALININREVNARPYEFPRYICKNYVEDKYLALVKAGIPPREMAVVDGITYDSQEHVVLRVQWYGDFYYLDNRHDYIARVPGIAVRYVFDPASPEWRAVLRATQ